MVSLRRPPATAPPPLRLDPDQEQVLATAAPLVRVLGAPGTGKSTLAVELVAAAVAAGRATPDACLVLAPTRLAAAALRDRLTGRLGGTTTEPLARTAQALGFAVLRREAALRGDPAPRLLSGPEQDVVLRDLLAGHAAGSAAGPAAGPAAVAPSAPVWPERVRPALGTRGVGAELRDLLMRAVEHGIDAPELARLGREHDRPEWVAAAAVLAEYDEVTALSRPGAYDPAWILTAAADLLDDDPAARARVHGQLRLIVVDDAHELTWAATRLLRLIAHPQAEVVLLADPDSAVQTFRGADPRIVGGVTGAWPELAAAPTVVLGTAYRTPAAIHAAAARVVRGIGAAGGGAQRRAVPATAGGQVRVALVRAVAQEAALIASTLRRAHLHDGMPWHEMAVVVRGRGRTGTLRRVLAASGVPLAAPTAELPVRDEVAVRPLLTLLELIVRMAHEPTARVRPEEAAELCISPLGGADAVSLRRLRRALRRTELDGGGRRTSDELLAAAVGDPVASGLSGPDGEPLRRITRAVVAGVRAARRTPGGAWAPGVTAESVLWAAWSALGIADGWRREALRGGQRAAAADRDLDAVLALFEAAARHTDRLPGAGPESFLEHIRGEEVPGDTLAPRAPTADAVALLTPAAAAGRQWRLVCVAGVQEGVWPDLRLRGSLLGSEHLVDVVTGRAGGTDEDRIRAAQATVRHDEARLLHVAVTRASERLLVTAVRSEEETPSPYLDVLDPLDPHDAEGVRPFTDPGRAFTLAGLVGSLRRDLLGPDPLARTRAARHLARLAADAVPGADPASWWALVAPPDERPRRAPDQPVPVSPSKVEQFGTCPLQWLLRSSGGDGVKSPSAGIGTLVHDVLADLGDVDSDTLCAEIDRRWPQLGLPPGWVARRRRDEAHAMARRATAYAQTARGQGWELVGVEVDATVDLGRARLRGRVDRLERDAAGALRVVDYKTGSSKPRNDELVRHPQLGAYQAAVEAGAFGELGTASAGAALVQLGKAANQSVTVQAQPPVHADPDPEWARALVEDTAAGMAGTVFAATPGEHCRICPVATSCPAQPQGQQL